MPVRGPTGRGAGRGGGAGRGEVGPTGVSWSAGPDDRGPGAEPTLPLLLDLVEALCRSGASVPHALAGAGAAAGGRRGALLRDVAGAVVLGAPWGEAWASALAEVPALGPLERALRPAWEEGVAPSAALAATADALRRDRDGRAAAAAGRLGVRLVLPLGLCHLPAFVLVGLVPVLVSTAGTAL